ncbi:type I restriction endonuclease subunit R [Cytophaga hutchinsonii]|uniref:Restriction enzyme type I helicase subunit type I restriction enzyme HsdR n=1 Tax=Cytophaga hutchinsonii (strain ATCC 33406 / DSM 1761 / CIP 103989 / NBRC 15051 / NCIMB 9469 / D465) TaxID=269798 RepID=A0A6N4SVA3_CYTH3|nr:DEAD/DEAH box helicase family protein [Cytophaga hutchinsonii]ABG60178.1 restriction enzyme type I helicase subunit; type I restriction enzyme HsdR [Cytophaga hutchinsonii ATCC 33406]SFX22579.1 type I restriction enzyme, R subunit [Cytophaga hutchinsonii ATCC 33406]
MPSQTNEQALESSIEKCLTGTSLEQLKEQKVSLHIANERRELYRAGNGYYIGSPEDFNAQFALDEKRFWDFLETTQQEELSKLQKQSDWKLKIIERLNYTVKKYGILRLFRKGLDIDDAHFTLLYPLPLASSSETVRTNFESNQFSVTRQLRYSLINTKEEIDMVLFVNGLPFATMELKNHWTGQNAKVHGQNQYKTKRDINQPLLNFGRCIVHFAVDTDEAYMTTRLNGNDTFFLPFNLGQREPLFGKGNPVNPFGHKTSYMWEEIFTRKSIANIIQHFVRFDGKETDPLSKKTLYFPRYHQLDVVRKLVDDASKKGVGQTYLIQHSAGSGKSNSITWAAYQLIETYPESDNLPGSKGVSNPLFDSVIVVTDRRLLDKQIRENIKEFSEVKNIVAPAYSSKELKESLESGKKIIITTIQKFPFIVDGIADLSDKRFAVIIDEAHSSQSGTSAGTMNQVMGNAAGDATEDEEIDPQDKILEAMRARKMRGNASYLAFTATPKNNTLERFGVKQEDGKYKPFHLYSMKQAIEEGFILDVLANYTTYKSYYEIEKSIEDNPLFETVKAQKKLRTYVEQNKQTIATKADIMLDHFMTKLVNTKRLKGKAKAMVATQSIESAINYYFALKKLLDEQGNPFKIAIAFSGVKKIKGIEYTEDSLNDFPAHLDTAKPSDPGYISDKIARFVNMDEYRMLVVANKYLTGYDQPKLTAMYVDKKLQGVIAVQALSRLNRSADKLGKKTEDLFILDFYNTTEDIKKAFDPFYTATSLSKATDINVLHELKSNLDDTGVYEWSEVEDFVEKYFKGVNAQELSPIVEVAAERFNVTLELDDKAKADYKIKAKHFVKIYGQMASIMHYEVQAWEKLFWFLKFLIPKLIIVDNASDVLDGLLNSVDLSTYGLERVKLNTTIVLDAAETEVDPQNPNPRGAHGGDSEEDELDLIIKSFNERWFQGWDATPDQQRAKFVVIAQRMQAHSDYNEKYAENSDIQNRAIAFAKIIDDVMGKQRKTDMDLYRLYSQDEGFKIAMQDTIKRILRN